ncbi:type III secretion system inner membrane ring lipoprotein SctJ [Pandoraea sputorum]|uniref:type III secretion system inner membrane ring lipoprotein SctJ n=1 Tax=Pandoraea sputorum TaxID=93222 RepID=UPI0012415230|nr:type III secretion inner membrane ring lipoprotein SctJ [Pandoraea sputorum]VVE55843.1 EscJ/YscJ/HrcJ family type III secretion inner membrane ring protein [Pandoraea sputorum]
MKASRWLLLLCMLPLLAACKRELYSKLDEAEANQMLALLIYNKIPADKSTGKEGSTLRVDDEHFVNAVEVLRQNGLPRRKTVSMQDVFPSGQLVTSPKQEDAKLTFLKSQQLEKMLSSMDGVIVAEVSVAEPRVLEGETPGPNSAAVFIKYSPEVNLAARESEIRALVRGGIPGLAPERITLTLQRADYRYLPAPVAPASPLPWPAIGAAGGTALLGVLGAFGLWWRRRPKGVAP